MVFIQSKSNFNDGSASSLAVTPTSNIGSGRLLIVSIFWVGPNAPSTLTDISSLADTLGTSYSNAVFAPGSNSVDTHWGLTTYYGFAPSGGSDTITVTFAAAVTFSRIAVTEVSGANVSPLDQTSTGFASNSAPDSGAKTTTTNGELIYAFIQTGNFCTLTAGTNIAFTQRELLDVNTAPFATEDATQTTAGSISAQFNMANGPQSWGCQMVTFKPSSAFISNLLGYSRPIDLKLT